MVSERERRERDAEHEEQRVVREAVREVPAEEAEHRVDDGGDRPLDDLVADVAAELGEIVGAAVGAPRAPEEANVVEHTLVPARVLPDHLVGRLGHVHELEQGHRRHDDAARAEGVAERRVLRRPRRREAAERQECVEAHELVVAEADLRATEGELEDGPQERGQPGGARAQPFEPPQTARLVDQPGDGHADEDGRLLDRAHAAADLQAREVRERERHALVRAASPSRQDLAGDPAVDVPVRDGVGVAHADPDARRIVRIPERLAQRLGTQGPVELVRLPPLHGQGHEREPLLLPRRQRVAEAADQLGGRRLHPRMRRALFGFPRRDDHVELTVRIPGREERLERLGDRRLLERRDQMEELGRGGGALERRLVGERVEVPIRGLDEPDRRQHPLPVQKQLERRARVDEQRHPEGGQPEPAGSPEPVHERRATSSSRTGI